MSKLVVIHTGGTISMQQNEEGNIGLSEQHPLANITDNVDIPIHEIEFFFLPSPHITPKHMLELSQFINKLLNDEKNLSGIVITHGTDTLEETAFFLDLTIKTHIPIVITGAMRPSNEIGTDAIHNFQSAIRVANCNESINNGVLVVMNDEIHSARYVTKTSTSNVATFKSPPFGPIGLIHNDRIIYYQQYLYSEKPINVQQITKSIHLFKAYTGMSPVLFEQLNPENTHGLVIEAFGQGNLPPAIIPALEQLQKLGIIIVIVSRCYNGIVQPTYDYEGGGKALQKSGMIFTNQINGPKARLKLLLLLQQEATAEEIQHAFQA
ncbi:asparaginase [Gracilibacillus oryzae]|uniref:asparaginase n=1 Tax=Gracilibacillus oryzae TaxID=1672701 RepID=A0A7C8GUM4_9BACI|nr:asparaginase [Gracilibacillus oryzae]KAB8138358.1 asparaginase [Gracilibacillus oryzae]